MQNRFLYKIALVMSAFLWTKLALAQGTLTLLPGTEKIYAIENGIHRLVGTVSFSYQGNTMYCDSAHYNEKARQVNAYGNVHIQKGNINLFADSIFYDEHQKYAKLWGHVRARDDAYKMSADSMDYDAKRGRAIFRNKGSIESTLSNEKIVCDQGYFYPGNGSFFFHGHVAYRKEDLRVSTDTLQFAYEQQKLYFLGPTHIQNDSLNIYCRKGWFHVQHEYGALYNHAEIYQPTSIIKADTLLIHTKQKRYEGKGSVYYKEVTEQLAFLGQHALVDDSLQRSYITKQALAFKVRGKDTLYIHADSLILWKDTLLKPIELLAHSHFRLLYPTLQGIADSAHFNLANQVLTLKNSPILWSNHSELKATTAQISFQDSLLESIQLIEQATFLMQLDTSSYFQQLSGKSMQLVFNSEGKIEEATVEGNAWTIYYPVEENKTDSTVVMKRQGLNRLFAARLIVEFNNQEVSGITYFEKPDGVFFPMDQIPEEEKYIKGFSWNPKKRPTDPKLLMAD